MGRLFRRFWRRWLGWIPIQFCMVCGKPYWGGLPWSGWRPWMQDFCSRDCCDVEMDRYADDGGDDHEDDWEDDYERAASECGKIPGQGCTAAGSEHCDFECPFRDALYGLDDTDSDEDDYEF